MVTKRYLGVLAVSGALSLVVGACGSDSDDESSGDTSTETTQAPADEGTKVAVELGEDSPSEYFLKADPGSVPAGPITFTVKNSGTTKHEMVVMKTDTAPEALSMRAEDPDKVEEEGMIDELESFDQGLTENISLDLEPGKYVLVCNIAKHYDRGMFSSFTVE
jgi:uncharacterized cupredoxin-like copper-binding protein